MSLLIVISLHFSLGLASYGKTNRRKLIFFDRWFLICALKSLPRCAAVYGALNLYKGLKSTDFYVHVVERITRRRFTHELNSTLVRAFDLSLSVCLCLCLCLSVSLSLNRYNIYIFRCLSSGTAAAASV